VMTKIEPENNESRLVCVSYFTNPFISSVLALPYSWTQELEELDITVPVPQGTRGADLIVVLRKGKLSLALKGPDREPILEGELCKEIKVEDSTWTIRKCMSFFCFKY
jgi:hypothetical protein